MPARKIKASLAPALHGGAFLNRQAWKFQGWLQGYNGGPLRQPTQRIHDPQMAALRNGLIDAGLEPSMDPYDWLPLISAHAYPLLAGVLGVGGRIPLRTR